MSFFKKPINSDEYLELKKELSAMRIEMNELDLNFSLIVKKLKIKYKISKGEDATDETKGLNNPVLLPE